MQGTQIDRAIIAADMSLLQNISSEEFTRQIDSAKHKLSDMLVREIVKIRVRVRVLFFVIIT